MTNPAERMADTSAVDFTSLPDYRDLALRWSNEAAEWKANSERLATALEYSQCRNHIGVHVSCVLCKRKQAALAAHDELMKGDPDAR